MLRLKVSSAGKGCLNLMHVCQYNLCSSTPLPAYFPHHPREDRGRSSPKDPRLKCQHLSGGSGMRVEDTFIRGILRLTEAARWNLLDEIMDRTTGGGVEFRGVRLGVVSERGGMQIPSCHPTPCFWNNQSRLIFHA